MLAFVLAINIATAILSSRKAETRGRSARRWLWLGLAFGPFAWLTVALLPAVRPPGTA